MFIKVIQFPAWDVRYLNYPLEIQINKIRWIIKIALNYVAIFSYLKSGLRKKKKLLWKPLLVYYNILSKEQKKSFEYWDQITNP